jgi:hypothetical protein
MQRSLSTTLQAAAIWLAVPIAYAHQPLLNEGTTFPLDAPYEIEEPEISKAIFGELAGEAHYYRIRSDVEFRFYAGVTAPKIDDCPLVTTFSFDVLDGAQNALFVADGETFEWWPWYEEFGRKWYWVGPEIGEEFKANQTLPAGTYYIRVHNAQNAGKYVLAIGDIESFPLGVIARTVFTMPTINALFWDDSDC